MKRNRTAFLKEWLKSTARKPLVIRGARQVGKTWLVRDLAHRENLELIELNFERKPQLASLFNSNDPHQIILNLSAAFNTSIDIKRSLLFLDEIQAAPELMAKLRWFAEDMPDLPVIAAGSLLEFLLESHTFSMPVGRIHYMHLEPLSFEEFLRALENESLLDYLRNFQWGNEIPKMIHEKLMANFKEYLIIGGMPAAVTSWITKRSLKEVNQVHHNLMATYRDDFAKYKGRGPIERLEDVMVAIPKHLGEKFVYTKVNPEVEIPTLKNSLELLCKARLCHRVMACYANGLPLGAEINERFTKVIFLDVGLCTAALGLSLNEINAAQDLNLINKGGISEQVIGQLLRTLSEPYIEPILYYWHREEKGSSAEVDYIFQHRNLVIPLEVKSGKTGTIKSLHLFMGSKGYKLAVRVNSDSPSRTAVNVKDHLGNSIDYTLISLPFYLFGQVHRLLEAH